MISWIRRQLSPVEPRATVTFLADGQLIIGLPKGLPADRVHAISERLREIRKQDYPPELLVFPFPVDVVDLRFERVKL